MTILVRSLAKRISPYTGAIWRWLTEPAGAVREPESRRQARLLAGVMVAFIPTAIWILYGSMRKQLAVSDILTVFQKEPSLFISFIGLIAMFVVYGLSRTRHHTWGGVILTSILCVGALSAASNATTRNSVTSFLDYLVLVILLASWFLPLWSTVVLYVAALAGIYAIQYLDVPAAALPDSILFGFQLVFLTGILLIVTAVMRQRDQNQIQQQARDLVATERESARRAQAQVSLQERATHLELVTQVGRRVTAILDLDELLHQTVDLIGDAFDYYSVVIGLVDGDDVVIEATSLPASQHHEGHSRLQIGVNGIIGWVAGSGESLLVPDVSKDSRYYTELETIETKSEAAVPIKLKDVVIGVLDVQNTEIDAVSLLDVFTLQVIADQLAVAIENARLYDTMQQEIAERTRAEEGQRKALAEALQATRALRKSEERYRAVVQAQADLVYRYSLDGMITFANDAYCQFYGGALDEIIGTDHYNKIPVEERKAVTKHIANLSAENPAATNECRNTSIQGESRWFHWTDRVILDQDGDIVEYQAVGRDITDRKQVEEALRAAEQLFSYYVDNIDALVFIKDRQSNYTFINKKEATLFNVTRQDLEKRQYTDFDFFDKEMAEQLRENDRQVMETGHYLEIEELGRPEGEQNIELGIGPRHYLVLKFPLKDKDDNVVGVCGFSHDITDQKKVEQALQASLREKEVLLQEIHHRVKNNLAIVSSLLSFQAEITPDERARAAFQESQNRIQAMARIHEHLYRSLDMARIDMAQYVREVADHLAWSFGTPAIVLQTDVSDVALDIDRAMPCGLIINELVSNALKHAFPPGWQEPQGGQKVRVAMRLHAGQCELTVADNGAGLPDDFQIESVERESLGLRLVNILSRQLKGNIQVDREGGTTFCLTFAISRKRN